MDVDERGGMALMSSSTRGGYGHYDTDADRHGQG